MLLIWCSVVALALIGLLAGLHATGQFVLNPPLRSLDFGHYLTFKRLLDRDAPRLAKPLMLTSLFVTTLTTIVAIASLRPVPAAATVIALGALILTLVAILRGDQPINRTMATWHETVAPVGWQDLRARWERFFLLRFIATAVALVAMSIGTVASATPV